MISNLRFSDLSYGLFIVRGKKIGGLFARLGVVAPCM